MSFNVFLVRTVCATDTSSVCLLWPEQNLSCCVHASDMLPRPSHCTHTLVPLGTYRIKHMCLFWKILTKPCVIMKSTLIYMNLQISRRRKAGDMMVTCVKGGGQLWSSNSHENACERRRKNCNLNWKASSWLYMDDKMQGPDTNYTASLMSTVYAERLCTSSTAVTIWSYLSGIHSNKNATMCGHCTDCPKPHLLKQHLHILRGQI